MKDAENFTYKKGIFVFIKSLSAQSGDATMAKQLTLHFSLAVLSLFDKGQQTLPSQQDCVSPSRSCCFEWRSVGWTNINKPYAAYILLKLVLSMWRKVSDSPANTRRLSRTASWWKAWSTVKFIEIKWIPTIKLTRLGAPKGQFQKDTSSLQSELCGVSSGVWTPNHLFLFLIRLTSLIIFPTKHRFTVWPIKAHIHAQICQRHDSFGPGPSLSSAPSNNNLSGLERSPPARCKVWHNLPSGGSATSWLRIDHLSQASLGDHKPSSFAPVAPLLAVFLFSIFIVFVCFVLFCKKHFKIQKYLFCRAHNSIHYFQ